MLDEGVVPANEFRVFPAFKRFEKNGVAINFDHDHDILITTLQLCGKLSGLVHEDSFANVVDGSEDILYLLATKRGNVGLLKRNGFAFCGAYIFSCLVHVALCSDVGLRIIFEDILLCEYWPAEKFLALMPLFHLDLIGWQHAACIHYSLFDAEQVKDTVGLA